MTHIKICGITTLNDALAAVDAGADLLGFNFYPQSPRYIEPDSCRKITSLLGMECPHITLVGVFVNSPAPQIGAILETCHLHLAQLHGDEPPEMLAALGKRAFKAFRGVPTDITAYTRDAAPALLVDSAVKGLYGGSGVTTDWGKAAELSKQIPLLLAGGLTPGNVAQAIAQVRPWGVDTASGVESSPGVKDVQKMRDFVAAARNVK
ncbi:MAG: phosphoribosylanthranilate isomerase [Anaerolineales bacterium]